MQNELLVKHPSANVRVYAVWEPVLPGDSANGWDPKVLNDPRVTNYWDPHLLLSRWLGEHVTHSGAIVWDHYFLYGPNASWTDAPGPLVGDGGDVIHVTGQLRAQFDSAVST